MKYIAVEWPDIQDYMPRLDFKEKCYFDPSKNTWLIPEEWLDPYCDLSDEELKEVFEDMEADSTDLNYDNYGIQ